MDGSTMVEHSPHHPKVEASGPPASACSGNEKIANNFLSGGQQQ
jgi:hypothetical protein